jgi:hypothetical protein
MDGILRAVCPRCKAGLRIPAEWVGQAVKCKKCGAVVRSKKPVERPVGGPSPDDTATSAPVAPAPVVRPIAPHAAAPQPNAFDFDRPAGKDDDGLFQLPEPSPAPAPVPVPAPPPLDANGYPIPPGYPYPLPPGYPAPPAGTYPLPPGYPYAPPPGYPYPLPPGYAPPPGYPLPPGYPAPAQHGNAPPGYPYPQPMPAPAPVQPNAAPPRANPAAPENDFNMDPTASAATAAYSRRRPRRTGGNKLIWVGLCLVLTAGLVAAGIFGGKYLNGGFGPKENEQEQPKVEGDPNAPPAGSGGPKVASTAFPRRLLFISITKYMYLNPLTATQYGADKSQPFAARIAFDWRVPQDKDNNQLFVLSDTARATADRLPMKNVVQGAYQEFFNTTRGQDRIVVYFGGHAVERDGKAYLVPVEGELEGEGWEQTLIPLEHFYGELQKVKAAQKVVIWDVCRFNPDRQRVRPGSEPMTEALGKALSAAPPGVQVVTTCSPGENALEFNALIPDPSSRVVYSGSSFLESMKFVGEKNKAPAKSPSAADPIPVAEWHPAVAKRAVEMTGFAAAAGYTGKQTVRLTGAPPASPAPPDPSEKAAARFEFPTPPKGASAAEVAAVVGELRLPPLRPGLGVVSVLDIPFPADVMNDYKDDVPLAEVMKDKEKYKFRATVLAAFDKIRDKWSSGAGTTKIRDRVEGAINDNLKNAVKKEQEFWAVGIAELELQLLALEGLAPMRESQPKRWQAHYDFALASMKARLAYMNEYNKLLGNLVTETIPPLDPKLSQDGYALVASDTLKSGREVKKMAEEAKELFQAITVTYKGTPWAIMAKQERTVAIGLNWQPASFAKAPPP